jgi:hypothetical protein
MCRGGRTLEVSLVLNTSTIYQRTPLPDFPIFALLYFFFGTFSSKIGIYDLDLAQGAQFWAFTQWEGGI